MQSKGDSQPARNTLCYYDYDERIEAFLNAVGTPREKTAHLRQKNIGHMPYVEAAAQEVQQAMNTFVDTATKDNQYT
jgi:hypothetical protein